MTLEIIDICHFFKLRMTELYHKDTLDSYRVRNHNAFTLLIELKSVAAGWLDSKVKRFETVKYCLDETIEALKEDICLDYSFLNKDLFLKDLEEYKGLVSCDNKDDEKQKAKDKTPNIVFLINKCITHNNKYYLPNLLNKIEEMMFVDQTVEDKNFVPYLQNFDQLLTSFATELIHIGYSKVSLYKYFSKLQINNDIDKNKQTFLRLRDKFTTHERNSYYVVFKLQISSELPQKEILNKYPEFVDTVPQEFRDAAISNKSYLNSNAAVRFYIHEVNSLDNISAIKEARKLLSHVLDTRQLGNVQMKIDIPHSAFTFKKQDNNKLWSSFDNSLLIDSTNGNKDVDTQKVVDAIKNIEENVSISSDVRDRIKFALRHLRIGDAQPEMEQRFINYWVGLEFIFSSPSSSDSTFMRMKSYLLKILTCCYAKRNMYRFNSWLIASKTISEGDKFWEIADIETRMIGNPNILAKYRFKKLKWSMLCHRDKRKKYVMRHKNNIERHLSRLYRLRNELIHEAGTKEDIDCATSNLRYYLVFLLNQVIMYFSNMEDTDNLININDFFNEFECTERKLSFDWSLQSLLNVDYDENLLT